MKTLLVLMLLCGCGGQIGPEPAQPDAGATIDAKPDSWAAWGVYCGLTGRPSCGESCMPGDGICCVPEQKLFYLKGQDPAHLIGLDGGAAVACTVPAPDGGM